MRLSLYASSISALCIGCVLAATSAEGASLVQDAEYYIAEAQNAERWAVDDAAVNAKLAAFRERNGGRPPNIFYILIDDIGFGDIGSATLNSIRGYKTPAINEIAREGMRLSRMYTEPSCTPTRVAFMTGRQPHRNGMGSTAVDISGFGLAAKEVTLAEVLSAAGYNTVHIGKAMAQLRRLAKEDRPFFLQYWPLYPLSNPRTPTEQYTTPNGGTYVEKMKLVDQWIGELMAAMDELGVADNTLVIVMGDNGHFTKYSPGSGYTPMIFRGGKGSTREGGVRVDAFVRWPGMIEADSVVGDMVHVADLFTTIARLGGASSEIPTDRIIDGIDQAALLLEGETHGRRDHVFLYNISILEAVVKEQYKLTIPGGKIENAILADFYDLYRDPQERFPVSTEIGAWGGGKFVRMIQRHMARKQAYPSEGPATGVPYDGIENLRPESKAAVEEFLLMMKTPQM